MLVNDGSRDGSWPMMQALAARRSAGRRGQPVAQPRPPAGADRRARPLPRRHDPDHRRRPAGPARAACRRCLRRCASEDADVVYGVRKSRAGETAFKRATAHGFYRLLSRATEVDIPLDTGDFRLMSRRALDALLAMPEQARFIRGMVAWIGFRQVPFAYDRAGAVRRRDQISAEQDDALRARRADRLLVGAAEARQPCGLGAVGRLGAADPLHRLRLAVGPQHPGLDLADAGRRRARRGADVRARADGRIYRPALQRGEGAAAVHRPGNRRRRARAEARLGYVADATANSDKPGGKGKRPTK